MTRLSGSAVLLASLFALLVCVGLARADGVWRLAGSFNGWNSADDAWRMTAVRGRPGHFALEKMLEPGRHEFKFVRDGDWGSGHFGLAADGSLEQPGANIPLRIAAPARYLVSLDTGANGGRAKWSVSVAEASEPTAVVLVRGEPVVGRPLLLDLSGSVLVGSSDAARIEVTSWGGGAAAMSITEPEATRLVLVLTPREAGRQELDVRLLDSGMVDAARLVLNVRPDYRMVLSYESELVRFERSIPLKPQPGGVFRALVKLPYDGVVRSMRVLRGEDEVYSSGDEAVVAGTYGVEVSDGGSVVTQRDPRLPAALLSGNWFDFRLSGESLSWPAREAWLVGSFNGWAGPGLRGSMPMSSQLDGGFELIANLPDGAHTYRFVADGDRLLPDARRRSDLTDAQGEPLSVVVAGPRPEDFGPAEPGAINVEAVRHNETLASDFLPISRGLGLAELSVHALPGDAERVFALVTVRDGDAERVIEAPMRRELDAAGFDRWTARVMSGGPEVRYAFRLEDGEAIHMTPRRTVSLGADPLQIPDWAKGAVWYQIFTERFRNGNELNDPHGEDVFLMPWSADWYSPAEGERAALRRRHGAEAGSSPTPHNGLFHWVWDRRYGGDLQGVVEKLDDLSALGVTAIYFNPVFEGESMHKYDATDFRHIDDNFGTPASEGRVPTDFTAPDGDHADPSSWRWTAADRYFIDVLLPEAKRRGIRVVIDGVWNHTGRDYFAFENVRRLGAESPFRGWFFVEFDDDGRLASWRAWDGPSGWLPKFLQTSNRDLVPAVKRHIFDVTRRWMDPNGDGDPSDGVDGWRLDVPLDIGEAFWEDWRRHVKSINEQAVIIAEIWQPADRWMTGRHFCTQMHYPFADAVVDWLAVRPGMTSRELVRELEAAFNDAPQTNLIHQNLFGSHDTDRYVSMLHNPGREYDGGNRLQDNGPGYDDTRPPRSVYELSLLGVAIQATYIGAPMIYYGDEVGMWGADDPTNRKPFPWPDAGLNENPDDRADFRFRDRYARWFNLRRDGVIGPVLRYGDVRHLDSGRGDIFAFERRLNGTTVVVVVNKGRRTFNASRLLPEPVRGRPSVNPVSARYWVFPAE